MNEELKIIISAEVAKLKQGVKDAQKQVKTFAEKAKDSIEKFNKEFEQVGNVSKKALATMGTAAVGAATALLALTASTAEYRTAQAKLNAAFESAGGSAETAKKTYNDLYRVLGDSDVAVEAANHLAQITTNEKELEKWTTISQGVFATWGDSIEQAGFAEAINHTIKLGETQGTLADGLEWAGISVEDFNAKLATCNTEEERAALIQTTLNGLYGDAASKYEETGAAILAQNEAQSKLNNSMATVGEALAPINTALTTLAADILAQLTPYIQEFADKYLPAVTDALANVGTKIGEVFTWIADNWELVSTLATVVISAAAAFSTFSTVMGIVNAVTAASPVTWIVLGIVAALIALAAIIVVVVQHWDEIKEAVSKAVEIIKQKVLEMVEKVTAWFNNLKEKIGGAVQAAKDAVINRFNEIRDGITEKIAVAKTKATEIVQSIVNTFRNKFNSAKNTVLGIFDSIKSGIQEKIDAAKTFVGNTIDAIKGFFDFEWSLPDIPMPHFKVTGKLDLLVWPPQVPSLSVDWYARGGVFDKPTLFGYSGGIGGLGEAGAEAIVPLEKNTKWLDIIADKLAARQGSQPIILEVDGKTFAQISVDSINQLTRQRGSLALNLI